MTGPLSALVDAVVEEAKGRARRSYAGRLDPALLLALDELTNICPLPQIPSLVSQSGGQGIFVAAILQNFAQAERRYGLVGLRMLLAASTVRVLLGGGVDAEDMERWGKLFGEYDQTTFSVQQSSSGMSMAGHIRRQPIYDSTQLRQLVERQALVSYRSLAPVMLHQDRTFDRGTRFCGQRKESMARFPTMTEAGQAVSAPAPGAWGASIEAPGYWR